MDWKPQFLCGLPTARAKQESIYSIKNRVQKVFINLLTALGNTIAEGTH